MLLKTGYRIVLGDGVAVAPEYVPMVTKVEAVSPLKFNRELNLLKKRSAYQSTVAVSQAPSSPVNSAARRFASRVSCAPS